MIRKMLQMTVEVDGIRLSGFYAVQFNMVTVWNASLGSRTRATFGNLAQDVVQDRLIEVRRRGRACALMRDLDAALEDRTRSGCIRRPIRLNEAGPKTRDVAWNLHEDQPCSRPSFA